ncbi:WecB/TagA/CpsF family glycosyltransferase [Roseibium sp.]|uniref:WecB/TagA/CpsF family glycosyltransferase n=1 Tax=Roseibium sp. TaxID=1936156 RepID=UPI003A970174
MNAFSRYKLFDIPVDTFNKKTLLDFISDSIRLRKKVVVAHVNVHAIYCSLKSAAMSALYSRPETYVHIDGMPIVALLRAKGADVSRDNRLTYLDWASDVIELAARSDWRIAYIGSTEEICAKGVDYFQSLHPSLSIRGWDGYFDMSDKEPASKLERMIGEINDFRPDLLIVGMGMPRQETFLHLHFDRLDFKVALCSGAFFEYFVGGQAMPPRWTGRLGVEWLYRLLRNPTRYAERYLLEPWKIIMLLIKRRMFGGGPS